MIPRIELLALKLAYFFLCALINAVSVFQAQMLKSLLQFNVWEYGYLGAFQIFKLIGSLMWTRVVDAKPSWRKPVLLMSVCGYSVCMVGFLVPALGWPGMPFKGAYFACLTAVAQFVLSAAFPIIDTVCLQLIEDGLQKNSTANDELEKAAGSLERIKNEKKHSDAVDALYRKQRVWGSIGFAAAPLLASQAIRATKDFPGQGYPAMYALMAAYGLILSVVVLTIFPGPQVKVKSKKEPHPSSSSPNNAASSGWKRLLGDGSFLQLMLLTLTAGWTKSIVVYFVPYFEEKHMGLSPQLLGYISVVKMAGELSVFMAGSFMVSRWGLWRLLWFALVVKGVKLAFFGLLPLPNPLAIKTDNGNDGANTPSWILAVIFGIEFLGGITGILQVLCLTRLTAQVCPDPSGLATSAQGLFSGLYSGLSEVIAGCLNGFCLQVLWNDARDAGLSAMQTMFLASALIFAGLLCLFIAFKDKTETTTIVELEKDYSVPQKTFG